MKRKLTLAEAILIGEPLIPDTALSRERGPVTMALKATGRLPINLDDAQSYLPGQYQALAYPGEALEKTFPWLRNPLVCSWCGDSTKGAASVDHLHSHHVTSKEIRLEEAADWLSEVESEPQLWELGLGSYFGDTTERSGVVREAKRQNISVTPFLAAAVRFVLKHQLPIADLVRPDPSGIVAVPEDSWRPRP